MRRTCERLSLLSGSQVGYALRTFSDLIYRKNLKMVRGAYPTTIPTA